MSTRLPRLTLQAETAAELMSDNPISVREDAAVHEAIRLMTSRGYSVAPVIDDSGRPVGVVSVTDILVHDRELVSCLKAADATVAASIGAETDGENLEFATFSGATVADIMTPTVFMVRPTASVHEVVKTMIDYRIHHLFVADPDGTLVGVIGMSDILRKLA